MEHKINTEICNLVMGKSIRYFRKKRELTLKQMSIIIYDKSCSSKIYLYETGAKTFNFELLILFCDRLGVTISDLFNRCEVEYKRILED